MIHLLVRSCKGATAEDIRRRIEAGASIEAIGDEIRRTGDGESGPP
jgi:hypothetical protein